MILSDLGDQEEEKEEAERKGGRGLTAEKSKIEEENRELQKF